LFEVADLQQLPGQAEGRPLFRAGQLRRPEAASDETDRVVVVAGKENKHFKQKICRLEEKLTF
jgi:hypothetical protein